MKPDIHAACSAGDVEAIKAAVRMDRREIGHERDGYVPVQRTIPANPDALAFLLECGEEPNRSIHKVHWFEWENEAVARGLTGWRLVHMAALHGYHANSTRTLEVLRQFGADLAAPSPLHGYSALHLAAIPNMQRVVRWLVGNGADVDIRSEKTKVAFDWSQLMDRSPFQPFDGSRVTPLMVACGEGHFDTARTLIELGAEVSAQDSSGHAPLHYAAGGFWTNRQQDYARIVELLRLHGASADVQDQQGRRPVDLAHLKEYESITTVLESSR
jgi:ankyrin repeat protein